MIESLISFATICIVFFAIIVACQLIGKAWAAYLEVRATCLEARAARSAALVADDAHRTAYAAYAARKRETQWKNR